APRGAGGDGRRALNTGGSSSGAGTASSFWAASVGTETSGSILSPANQNMLAAVKPTVGRISRHGVIPITADQDTPGPMARTVADAAILLGVLEGAPDPDDPATGRCPRHDYLTDLKADGLRGARIGVPRARYYEKLDEAEAGVMTEALAILRAQGAVVIDPANIPSVVDGSLTKWGVCVDMDDLKEKGCSIDLGYGMERDFNGWLRSLGTAAPVKSLAELRRWNLAHAKLGAIRFGQSLLDFSDAL